MTAFLREARLFFSLRSAVLAVAGLFLLAAAGVGAGLAEIARQQAVIARIAPQQAADVEAIADWVSRDKDPGNAAYYTFHPTWDPPSNLAFAALGTRDVAPYILRVRALGLEAQLYEGEIANPEAALPGRFDFAFVLVYLAPLFVILLFHDLRSGEREAGRLGALETAAGSARTLWSARIAVRGLALFAAQALPFLAGALLAGVAAWKSATVLGLVLAYLAFWIVVCLVVARAARSSLANAMTLAATWLVLTLIVPAVGHVAINAAIPLRQGMELSLLQRTAVHRAWDIPKSQTMQAFFRTHPEWADTAPLTTPFHWKWYFAFHQVGDQSVADLARDYRDGVLERAAWSERLGQVLPGVGVQLALHRLADTDPQAQMAYLDRIRAFHAQLRRFYYPYIFNERPFDRDDFARAPAFHPRPAGGSWSVSTFAGILLVTVLVAALGLAQARRQRTYRPAQA
jgi:ABC-2 type transport system permease protein